MPSAHNRLLVGETLRRAWIVWGAIVASLAIYLAVPSLLGAAGVAAPLDDELLELVRMVLYGLSAASFILAGVMRKVMLRPRPAATGLPTTVASNEARTVNELNRYVRAVAVSVALVESIAIYGLVLYVLGAGPDILYIMTAITAVAMGIYCPKRSELEPFLDRPRPQ